MEWTMELPASEKRNQTIIQAVADYGRKLFNFIRDRVNTDEDAEDILQDVWHQFSNMMNIEPVEQTSAWLYRVARNRIIDQYRRRQPPKDLVRTDDEFYLNGILLKETPETEHLRNFFWEQLFHALDELPKEQQQVFVWNELEDVSFNEIADRTGENINTLISRKRYAILHLRKRLKQLYIEFLES